MGKEVILATDTENISLTGNNETYTKSEIDDKLKTVQNNSGGKLVWSGTCSSDSSVTIPSTIDIDYVTAWSYQSYSLYGEKKSWSSGTVKLVAPSSSVDVTFMASSSSSSFNNIYGGTFSLSTNTDGSHLVKSVVNSSKSYYTATCTFYAYKYF